MAGTLFRVGAVEVFIPADDHWPPHVHARHPAWRHRFRFSFLADMTGLYRFQRRGLRPTDATLNGVATAIIANLPACRESWWVTHGDIGLINQRVETRRITGGDGVRAKVAMVPSEVAVSIVSASYDPGSGKITLALADRRTLLLTAGQHIEEQKEW